MVNNESALPDKHYKHKYSFFIEKYVDIHTHISIHPYKYRHSNTSIMIIQEKKER
jgi:hypothetical protein